MSIIQSKIHPLAAKTNANSLMKKLMVKSYPYGAVCSEEGVNGISYVIASKKQGVSYLPSLVAALEGKRNALYVGEYSGSLLLVFKQNGLLTAEYVINEENVDLQLKLVRTNLFALFGQKGDVYVATNVAATANKDKTTFDTLLLRKIDLDVPFQSVHKDVVLQPTELETFKSQISRSKALLFNYMAIGVTTAAVLAFGLVTLLDTPETMAVKAVITNEEPDSIKQFRDLDKYLTSTASNATFILRTVALKMNGLRGLPGWEAFEVDVKTENQKITIKISLESVYGTVEQLSRFAKQSGYQIDVKGKNGYLLAQIPHVPVLSKPARFHAGSYERLIIESFSAWWDDTTVLFADAKKQKNQSWIKKVVNISVDNVDPQDIHSMSSLLVAMPLGFESFNVKRNIKETLRWSMKINATFAGVNTDELG